MSEPFLSEIRIFSFNFAPRGWAACNGQLLSIPQNAALFSLIGTYYGGNGVSNFQLPNLQGLVPMHWGNGAGLTPRVIGETGGEPTHTLSTNEVPAHNHLLNANSNAANNTAPGSNLLASAETYESQSTLISLASNTLSPIGNNQSHENRQPYLVMNFCIALVGVFPSRN